MKTVKDLDLQVQENHARRGTYTSVGGKFHSLGYVKVQEVMFPVLSQDRIFLLELEVVPDGDHMPFSIIIVQNTMRLFKIDTQILTDKIILEDIHRSMVSHNC